MKNTFKIAAIVPSVLLGILVLAGCTGKQAPKTPPTSLQPPPRKLIVEFYNAYIAAWCEPADKAKAIEKVKNKYLTKLLRTQLTVKNADYMPILKAKDCDQSWAKTIEVEREKKAQDAYNACYITSYNKHCRTIYLKKVNGIFRIDRIEMIGDIDEMDEPDIDDYPDDTP
ncbi:hypothetical protein FACS1894103_3980 [Campylobacterota bacterium]|nr:hypothetical protein FACS1894103_3980 [Campylobacterota bacterium]